MARKSGYADSGSGGGHAPYAIALVLAVLLSIAAGVYFRTNTTAYNGWDFYFYIYYSHILAEYGFGGGLHYLISHGLTVFTGQWLLLGIPALVYDLIGINTFSVNLFEYISVAGAMAALFLIGGHISNRRAGLISAIAFAAVPAAVLELTSAGDGMPIAFFSSLAVLSFIWAERRGGAFYAIPGIVGVLGVIAGSAEVFFTLIFLAMLGAYRVARREAGMGARDLAAFLSGTLICLAALIGLYAVVIPGHFGVFTDPYYAQSSLPLSEVVEELFPAYAQYTYVYPFVMPYAGVAYAPSPHLLYNNLGFLGYAAALCAVYLVARKRLKDAAMPLSWLAVVLACLSFGMDRLSGGFIMFDPRFMIAAVPPMALVVGTGLDMMLRDAMGRSGGAGRAALRRHAGRAAAVAVLVVACVSATAVAAYYISEFETAAYHNDAVVVTGIAGFIETLPKNSTVYLVSSVINASEIAVYQYNSTDIIAAENESRLTNEFVGMVLSIYTGFGYGFNTSYVRQDCPAFKGGSYIVLKVSPSIYAEANQSRAGVALCPGLESVVLPQPPDETPANGVPYDPSAFGDFYVYYKQA